MLNWIVIGVGDISRRRVLPAILDEPRSRLAGVVTREPAKAGRYGVPGWTSLDQALDDSGADAVYVATPVFLHAAQTIAALRRGKHVLCEKPMAMNAAEAQLMVETARECGRTLGIAYYRRLYPKVNRARELMWSGAIGKPVFAELTSHDWFFPEDGFRSWLIDPSKAGGGPLYDIASHRIDLLNFWFGAPERASGVLHNAVHRMDVEDCATVLLGYADGVSAIVDVRWHSRVARDECRIRGTEGEMDLTPLNSGRLVYPGGEEDLPPHQNLHYPCLEEFVSAVLEGKRLRSTGASAVITDRITEHVMNVHHNRSNMLSLS